MAFTDLRYLLFLGLVAAGLPLIPRGLPRLLASALIGLGFYINLVPDRWYLLVVVSVTAYAGGLAISKLADGLARNTIFVALLVATLLPLLTFKYAATMYGFLPPAGSLATQWSVMADLILPIGISFYTFLALGYLIDVYVGSFRSETNALRFAACMWFFPHLTAG